MNRLLVIIISLGFLFEVAMASSGFPSVKSVMPSLNLNNFRDGDFEEPMPAVAPHWAGGTVLYGNTYKGYHGTRYASIGGLRSSMVFQELLLKPNTQYEIKFVAAIGNLYLGQNVSIINGPNADGAIIKKVNITNKAKKTGLIEYTLRFKTGIGLGTISPVTVKISPMAGLIYIDNFRLIDNSNNENQQFFEKRYYNNLKGNIKIIGNTVLKSNTSDNGKSNSQIKLKYVDIDKNSNTFNSSSATLDSVIDNVSINKSKIVWAGLYWTGYLHNDKYDDGIDGVYNFSISPKTKVQNEIKSTLANQEVLLKVDNGNYIHIKPDQVNRYRQKYWQSNYYNLSYVSYIYNAFANVTDILKGKNANHKYTVANIPTRTGETDTGFKHDGLGNFGAWTLVVVYDNSANSEEKTRNVTIFDGLEYVSAQDNPRVTINFEGFKTPHYAPNGVDSKISIFAAEGDKYILGDRAILTNQDGYSYTLPNASGTSSYFASSIDGVPHRNPKISNNNGIDIHINNVGTKYGKYMPIKVNQDKASLTMSSTQDTYIPTMVAFSTEVYTPKLCYDYSLRVNKFTTIPSQNRDFKLHGLANDELMFKVMIRSQESDFDMTHTKQYLTFTPNDKLPFNFDRAEVSYSNSNRYNDVTPIDSQKGIIPIGKHIDNTGGTIGASERMYSKTFYKMPNGGAFEGKFDVNVEGNISFDGVHDVHYILSTAAPKGSPYHLDRCPTNQTYDPIYGMFNVENGNATFYKTPEDRFSLPTQVTNVPYKVTVASYGKNYNGKYTVPRVRNSALEVEVIDAGNFENNSSSGYDATCEDPDSYSKGAWVKFDYQNRVSLKIPEDYPQYPKTLALRKAAFRMWVLMHKNNIGKKVPVPVLCKSQDDSQCFSNIYKEYYENRDDSVDKFCQQDCYNSNSGDSKCYDCLRQYYAKPVCSRDVFSIRPDGFRFTLKDNNQTNSYKNNIVKIKDSYANSESTNIVAGYKYVLDVNATTYGANKNSLGYYFLEDNNTKNSVMLNFNDNVTCMDKSNKNISVYLRSGATEHFASDMNKSINTLKSTNAGKYYVHMEDNKWTEVDQVGYPYRPFPNHEDCRANGAANNNGNLVAIRGCQITSEHNDYHDLHLNVHPYDIDISSISLTPNGSYIYANDLSKTKALISRDTEMAVALKGTLVAKDYNGNNLTNYTGTCAAKNLNIKLGYKFDRNNIKDSIGRDLVLQNALLNNTITLDMPVKEYDLNNTLLDYNFTKNQFVDINSTIENGKADFKTYINFKRDYNVGINPFKITITDLNLTSPNDSAIVEKSLHTIDKRKEYNATKTVYYAKVKSSSDFYDDITDNNVTTPVEIAVFCNDSVSKCAQYGINTKKDATNEYDWWIFENHTSVNGQVMLEPQNNRIVRVSPSIINNFTEGIDENVKVEDIGIPHRPYITKISTTSIMRNNYPWLLFNKDGNTPPAYIYKVRFVPKPSDKWSGGGGTGHTVTTNASGRKTKKIDW